MLPSLLTQLSNIDRIAVDVERQLPERLRECPFKWIGHGCQKPGDFDSSACDASSTVTSRRIYSHIYCCQLTQQEIVFQ